MNGERERVSFALHRVEQKQQRWPPALIEPKKIKKKKENQKCEKLVRPEMGWRRQYTIAQVLLIFIKTKKE